MRPVHKCEAHTSVCDTYTKGQPVDENVADTQTCNLYTRVKDTFTLLLLDKYWWKME